MYIMLLLISAVTAKVWSLISLFKSNNNLVFFNIICLKNKLDLLVVFFVPLLVEKCSEALLWQTC